MLKHPSEIEWIEGPLPDVHEVPYNCVLLVWFVYVSNLPWPWQDGPEPEEGTFTNIKMVRPWKNELNPLRWCDPHPIGCMERPKYWAWISKGTL